MRAELLRRPERPYPRLTPWCASTIVGWDGPRAVVTSLAIVTAVVAQFACPFWELVRMFPGWLDGSWLAPALALLALELCREGEVDERSLIGTGRDAIALAETIRDAIDRHLAEG